MRLQGKKAAVLAANDYEDPELWYPYYRLKEEGAEVLLIGTSTSADVLHSKYGFPVQIDCRVDEVSAADFDAVIIPGGWAPDRMRRCPMTVAFVRDVFKRGGVVAAICHAGWMLASADVLRGKTVTSIPAIRVDMENAGAKWVDKEVVVDGTLVTSRLPGDLPAYGREIVTVMAKG